MQSQVVNTQNKYDMQRLYVFNFHFQYLTALCMQYNALCCQGFTVLAPVLKNLKALQGLDLSCNNINMYSSHEVAELLGECIGNLPNLCRLDLSNNRIKNKLRVILTNMQKPLKHLELAGCGISDIDLQYLSISPHAKSLEALELSENNLGKHFEHTCALLNSIGNNLVILETEDCNLDQSHFTQLFYITSKELTSLRYWNISRNLAPQNSRLLMDDLKAVVSMKSLETILISYPEEFLPSTDNTDEFALETARHRYQNELFTMLSGMCENIGRPLLKVVLVYS